MTRPRTTLPIALATVALLFSCSDAERDRGSQSPGTGAGNGGGGGSAGGGNGIGGSGSGKCGVDCIEERIGQGGKDFDLKTDPNDGVAIDGDGSLVIARNDGDQVNKFIWVANSGDSRTGRGSVSKVDTTSMREVARYIVGAIDPSRTSVSINGDAYIGSRAGRGLTKISGLGANCPDTNGDGVVITSTGPADVLPWGQDDCVLWHTPLQEHIRGVAAQDIPGSTTIEHVPDSEPVITTTPAKHYVWAGGMSSKLYKLDGDTGAILIEMNAPIGIYGLALDGRGKLWMTHNGAGIAFVDTKQCTDNANCATAPCILHCNAQGCATTCDDAVAARIVLPNNGSYGITVDCKQRVWLAGYGGGIKRYDPAAPPALRFAESTNLETHGTHGIAADAKGFVWGAKPGVGVVRLDAEDLTQAALIRLADGAKGVAVDADGKVWGIPQGGSAHVIDPGPGLMESIAMNNVVTGLVAPYTYSDMTGQQLRFATDEPSTYKKRFEGCARGETLWNDLWFDVETPADTSVIFRARTADSVAELDEAVWTVLGGLPDWSANPISLADRLGETRRHLEIELQLKVDDQKVADRCSGVAATTPRVRAFSVGRTCGVVIQ